MARSEIDLFFSERTVVRDPRRSLAAPVDIATTHFDDASLPRQRARYALELFKGATRDKEKRRAGQPGGKRQGDFPPHVTIVHPRTSDRGRQAWDELASIGTGARFTITHVAITAYDGNHWQTLRLLPLTGTGRQADT